MIDKNLEFNKQQTETLKDVVDCIIPAKDPMPAASDAGAVTFITSASSISTQSRKLIIEGLIQIEIIAQKQGFTYLQLQVQKQREILINMETNHNQFFKLLLKETYNAYYTNPEVLKLIGLPGHHPQPLGYELNQASLEILKPVRTRGEIWRQV